MSDISTFISWFIQQFINIATTVITKLDNINLTNNVTLLDFIITITIIGVFINIVLTLPNSANNISRREERKQKKERKEK